MGERKKQAHFCWRYQPESHTLDAVLLTYIKNNVVMRTTDMMLHSLRAFWLPLACLKHPDLSEADKKQMARDAVYVLMRQVDYLCSTFGLERVTPPNSYVVSSGSISPVFQDTNLAYYAESSPHPLQLKEETRENSLLVSELEQATGNNDWDDNAWKS
ncbi:hypothetical protein [Iningainema tapete]|uniref:Uncharacterized protein n=1 Tax=Iningainema tapete BLCC-T55 TaxID=2748662 RepID=A0A8J6XHC3_9CYAN|nr:hypothetical protein [Iningainema tapete]MBD2772587.1 hypothetical protein [Iningainema tapete BLCC-T55]